MKILFSFRYSSEMSEAHVYNSHVLEDSPCSGPAGRYLMHICWWQVMYDATGVRLHAGRQAEVCRFSTLGSVYSHRTPLSSCSFVSVSRPCIRVSIFRNYGFNSSAFKFL